MDFNLILFVIFIVFCFSCIGAVLIPLVYEIKALRKEKQDLLNRLMAKNYAEYAQVELTKTQQAAEIEIEREVIPKNTLLEQDIYPVN
jgi:hypothetical protein